jgi:Kre9/KNH-like N-terminal Ig-like domain
LLVGTNDPGYITTDFEPTEKIIVSSPAKGEFYEPGELVQIKWLTSFSTIPKINIYLYRKSVQQRVIIQNLSNNGSYNWRIPDEIDNSIHYTVKIVNSIDEKEFNFSGRFGIIKSN